ncbi:hypothetical protein LT85_2585 [Collimonas arenae]|uniref:Uncharacterized protein n=1 Tax=Collimonas arenae TaxID=279058 RepID=A0A0A1FAK7_9BURK|nr:hypothetical protein LT85_2585 [Collimonas arenae]
MTKPGLLALSLFSLMIGADAFAQSAPPPQPQSDFPDHISGDLGLGVFNTPRNYLGKSRQTNVLPYAYFDYQRFFARLDTFGVKTFKIGDGYLELAGRVNFDGIDAQNGINKRSNSVPLGIGTYQETPFGAFFLNAFLI